MNKKITILGSMIVAFFFVLKISPANAALPFTPQEYQVQSGDTLWDLANHFYGNENKWIYIYSDKEIQSFLSSPTTSRPPALEVGDTLTVPEITGTTNGLKWEKLPLDFGNTTIRSLAFNPKKNIWLLGGNAGQYHGYNNAAGYESKPAPLYYYDGKTVSVASQEFAQIAQHGAADIFFDGAKFWIAAGGWGIYDNTWGAIFTFDGEKLTDMSPKILAGINKPAVHRIAGDARRLLFGGCKNGGEKLLLFYDGKNVKDLSLSNQFPWGQGCILDVKYNGSYWLISSDGFLYKFDGKNLINLATSAPLKSLLTKRQVNEYQSGITSMAWDPVKKRWLLTGWILTVGKGDVPFYALYDAKNNNLKNLTAKMQGVKLPPWGPGQAAYANGWWAVDGGLYNDKNNTLLGPAPWEGESRLGEGVLRCSKNICLLATGYDLVKITVPLSLN